MRRTTLIITFCISLLGGILLGYYFSFSISWLWLAFVPAAFASMLLLSKKLWVIPIVTAALVLGTVFVSSYLMRHSEQGLSQYNYKKLDLAGQIKGEPYWDDERNYVFVLGDVEINGHKRLGDVRIKTFSSFVKEGNRVRVSGKLFPILAKPGYQISYAAVSLLDSSQPPLTRVKAIFYKGVEASLAGDSASFVKGVLFGARSSLSKELRDTMNNVGLSHVTAVSGYNLTIMVAIIYSLLKKRWAWGSVALSLAVIWVFAFMSGFSASISRAAIMATVFILASYYGRPLLVYTCVALAAVLTLLPNPTALIEDIGWQLSFISLLGIVVISPILLQLFPKRPESLMELLAITLAAQLATVPYIMLVFGSYSLVSLLANMVVMPFIPVIMLGGFVLGLIGVLMPADSYILGNIASAPIRALFEFMEYLSSQKGAIVKAKPEMALVLLWYLLIATLAKIFYKKRLRAESLSFQSPDRMLK